MIAPLFASIAPFVLWPIEFVFPYPHFVEEIAKAGIVLLIIPVGSKKSKIALTVASGILFTLSETVLFSLGLFGGESRVLLQRLALTTPLHVGTLLIMLFSTFVDRRLLIVGLIIGVIIHYIFNQGQLFLMYDV